jgi:hypothetical protein
MASPQQILLAWCATSGCGTVRSDLAIWLGRMKIVEYAVMLAEILVIVVGAIPLIGSSAFPDSANPCIPWVAVAEARPSKKDPTRAEPCPSPHRLPRREDFR